MNLKRRTIPSYLLKVCIKNELPELTEHVQGLLGYPFWKLILMFLLLYLCQGHHRVPSVSRLKVILREKIGEEPVGVCFIKTKKPLNMKKDI